MRRTTKSARRCVGGDASTTGNAWNCEIDGVRTARQNDERGGVVPEDNRHPHDGLHTRAMAACPARLR